MLTLVLFVYFVVIVAAALAVGLMTNCLIVGIVSFEYLIHLLEEHDVVLIDFRLPFLLELHALGVGLGERGVGWIGPKFFGLLRVGRVTLMVMRFL